MKKLFISSAALLLCFLAYSQASDETGSIADVSIISRFDYNPYFGTGNNQGDVGASFGNSAIYTLIEGQPTETLSYTVCNHWFAEDPSYLYEGTLHSNTNNWLDMFYVDFALGNWNFTVGKHPFGIGGREFEAWDWDSHFDLATPLWNTMCSYQWGTTVCYTLPSEKTSIKFNFATSPYGEQPFGSGLFAYTLRCDGEYSIYSDIVSISAMQLDNQGNWGWLACISQRVNLKNFIIDADWYNASDFDSEAKFAPGNTFRFNFEYTGSESICAGLCTYIVDYGRDMPFDPWMNIGAKFEYMPLKNHRKALTLHATAAYNSLSENVSLMVGLKANMNLFNFKRSK